MRAEKNIQKKTMHYFGMKKFAPISGTVSKGDEIKKIMMTPEKKTIIKT